MARKTAGREATTGVIEWQYVLGVGNPGTPAPEGWRWTALSEVARLESGHTPSRRKPEYWGGSIPWVGIKDATGNHGRTIRKTMQHTNELGIANSAARVLPANTVCLSRTASVGYVIVMGKPMATSQDFANWVCSEKLDYRFLKFALLAERDSFSRFSYGSTHQTIYYPELKAFHICLPPLAEQRRIADVLQALDDKIEVNSRTNVTLEEMARALYRSWFVDFDPVHARALGQPLAHMDTTTAALFPDSFGPDGLPKGWEAGTLMQVAQLNPEKWSKRSHPDEVRYLDLANVKRGGIETVSAYQWDEAPSRARMVLRKGDTIVGTVRPGNGSYALIHCLGLTASTGFAVLRAKNERDLPFLYCAATSSENIERLTNLADGAAYPAVRPEVVGKTLIVLAPDSVCDAFSFMTSPWLDRCGTLAEEAATLAALRDTLLPRLMSGELRIRDAEKQVEEVV